MSTEDILRDVNLRFVSDKKPGFSRKVYGKGFKYFDREGKEIKEENVIERINKLAIPPAYTRVWISPYANGYLQAVGYDDRKRKQYRYHPLWIKISQKEKFSHIKEFAQALPKIRSKIQYDMEKPGMPKEKVVATVVWLLANTLIRVGNEEYEEENDSYGLTTLKGRHTRVNTTDKVIFRFKGKSGVYHKISVKNKRVASIIRRCKEIPGQDLFEYLDDSGNVQSVDSYDVNEYLKEITGEEITAKDFRTWGGTVLAASTLNKLGISNEENVTKENITSTFKEVAAFLGNRPATVRKYYVHPRVIDSYLKGRIISSLSRSKIKEAQVEGLQIQENKVLALLSY
ncbi:MAG TPA: DNA topoisomerase IB [Patescibacteria group bacterium]|nr:DNA topoisomerase IB [Patescibacteria group bacterium]